ncbi:hypothetical protein N0V86_004887 [Didymella sp. IMI 355093]|nr:hypothetical protein N0V86_004887 [Didymella sp. IMI 355093]
MHIGYTYIVFGPCSGQSRRVSAYLSCTSTTITEAEVHYCTSDDTIVSQQSVLNIHLLHPFHAVRLKDGDDQHRARRLRVLVLYYFRAKRCIKNIKLTDTHLSSFKIMCANVAKIKRNDVETFLYRDGHTEAQLTTAQKRHLNEQDDEVEDDVGPSQIEEEGVVTKPAKKRKHDDSFAEYQKLVSLIRGQVENENDKTNAENSRLQMDLTLSQKWEDELKKQIQTLQRQVTSFQLTQSQIEEKCKQAEKEVDELRAWKKKIQSVCEGE